MPQDKNPKGTHGEALEALTKLEGFLADTVRAAGFSIQGHKAAEMLAHIETLRESLPALPAGVAEVDPELVRMGHAYVSCRMLIGQLRKLAESHPRNWDRFNACLFCKNHIDKGHIEGCLLVESQKAVLRYDDEQRRLSAATPPTDRKDNHAD